MTASSNLHIFHRCAASGPGGDASDSVCWEIFIETYGRLLRTSVRRAFYRCGASFSAEDVEEAEQEIYCRLLDQGRRRLKQFRGRREAQAQSFLRRVASSVVIDLVRRGSAQKRGGEMLERIARAVPSWTTRRWCSRARPRKRKFSAGSTASRS